MLQSDLDEFTGLPIVSRAARYLDAFDAIRVAILAGDLSGERAAAEEVGRLYATLSHDERWEVARQTGDKLQELSDAYRVAAAATPCPHPDHRPRGCTGLSGCCETCRTVEADAIDVRRVVQLTESVTDAFKNYVDGAGFDVKQLAVVVPKLLDDHVRLKAMRRAEIRRLDAEIDRLRADHRSSKSSAETQASISAWAEATFGPAGSNARAVARANREMSELLEHVTSDDRHPEAAEEIADVVIVLYRVATRLGVDLHELIDQKMAKNRARKWRMDGTGHGYHVEDATPTATTDEERERQIEQREKRVAIARDLCATRGEIRRSDWLAKIEALRPGDHCEFHYPARSQWLPGIVVVNGGAHYWSVCDESDAEGRRGQIHSSLYVEMIRLPGQEEAWR